MKKEKLPNLLIFAILTVITLVVWIGFEVYRLVNKSPQTNVPESILTPISPNLDQEVLSKIEKKIYINESELENLINSQTNPIEPDIEAGSEATPSPEINQGGVLH